MIAGALEIQLFANIARLADDMKKVESTVDRSMNNVNKAVSVAKTALGALGIGLGIREIINYTDRWTDLNAKLLLATKDGKLADDALARISQTARSTYSSIEQTSNAFLRNATTLTELGFSTSRQLDLTDALNNSLVISGTKGQAAESVMNALSKSFAQGELRGQNFNTVIQSGGRIVEALADGLGVTTIELRAMAEAGELKTAVVVDALTSQMEILRAEAALMPATVSDGFLLLGDAMFQMVGKMDQATGASSAVSGVLITIADNLETVGAGAGIVALGIGGQYVLALGSATTATAVATGAVTALRTVMLTLAGPAGAIMLVAGAMYLLVQRQKESADAAWAQAARFDELRSTMHQLTVGEIARAIQAEHEHMRSLERSRDQLEKASDGSKAFEERIRKLNLEIRNSQDNLGTLRNQLERAKKGTDDATGSVKELTEAQVKNADNLQFLNSLYQTNAITVTNTADAYVRLMGVTQQTTAATQELQTNTQYLDSLFNTMQGTQAITADGYVMMMEKSGASFASQQAGAQAVQADLSRVADLMRNDISSAFADMMMNGDNAFDAIAKSFERMIYKMVADWAAAGIMNMVSKAFGGTGGHTSVLGSILSGGASAAGSAAVSTATGGAAGGGMMAAAGGAVKAGGAALLGGAKAVGGAVLGGAQTALAAIGPVGWAIMGAAALNAIFGHKETPSYNSGFLLKDLPGVAADRKFALDAFESGLAPVGFNRRTTVGEAADVADVFRALDASIAGPAKAAGLMPNLSSLMGYDEQGLGSGIFFGMAHEKNKPGTAIEQQMLQYARGLIAGYSGAVDGSIINEALSQSDLASMVNTWRSNWEVDGSHRNGLDYVPFDGYRAELHKGEEVSSVSDRKRTHEAMQQVVTELRLLRADLQHSTKSGNDGAVERFGRFVDRFGEIATSGQMIEVTG